MNREIKFRVWNNIEEQMYPYVNVVEISPIHDYVRVSNGNKMFDFHDIELMQYIGLKDKNGQEIYEGDILKDAWSESVGVIKFSRGHFYISFAYAECFSSQVEDSEIIGNIYENPELINGE